MEISKTKLKAKLLEYLRLVEKQNEEIIITDHGKPVVKICKYKIHPTTEELFATLRGKVKYFEDITTPTADEWEDEI